MINSRLPISSGNSVSLDFSVKSDVADSLELEKQMDKPSKEEEAEEADELVIPRDPEHGRELLDQSGRSIFC